MNHLKTTLVIFALTIVSSCTSTKSSKEGTENSLSKAEIAATASKMTDAGYQKAIVVVSQIEGDCPVTLKLDNTTTFLDPINLNDKDAQFSIDGTKVWVTYNGLRMMNRCDKANPISIVDIQKRAE